MAETVVIIKILKSVHAFGGSIISKTYLCSIEYCILFYACYSSVGNTILLVVLRGFGEL